MKKSITHLPRRRQDDIYYLVKQVLTKEDIDALMPIVKCLFELVKSICEEKIREYGQMEEDEH